MYNLINDLKTMRNKVLAIISARGPKEYLKNIYNICGHPLLSYSIEAAKNSLYKQNIVQLMI